MRNCTLHHIIAITALVGWAAPLPCPAQATPPADKPVDRVVCYNVENLFDPLDDPLTQDNDFMPTGKYGWTWRKLAQKTNGIFKAILAAGQGNPPTLVGLCEVESRIVLNKLVHETPLARIGYGIVHRNSPDPRGIDVALLYRTDRFKVLSTAWHRVCYESGSCATREILYARGVLRGLDTLHILVTHFPSKWGGAAATAPKRLQAATTLRAVTDSILRTHARANILVMGDFNDTPDSPTVTRLLDTAGGNSCRACRLHLLPPAAPHGRGSLKYQKKWELIDLFFVSGNLLDTLQPVSVPPESVQVFRAPFLLEPDNRHLGEKPRRTHTGFTYNGGISDHLPVLLDITHNY